MTDPADGLRLQKLLAQAGVASRRACEELITAGRVEVDGEVVTRLGTRVDPARAVVRVDGARIPPISEHVYLALNKPLGVVSAMSDSRGRRCVGDLLGEGSPRLFHVGRLDSDTEGVLLLTNSGEFAHRVAHPSFRIAKTYVAEVAGSVSSRLGRELRRGVQLEDGPVQVDAFRVVDSTGRRSIVELMLHEGRNRIVRRLLASAGHPVQRLCRSAVGPVGLGQLPPGQTRPLTREELGALLDAVGL
jgi:23S rRNA pseudouridine2605 synthase